MKEIIDSEEIGGYLRVTQRGMSQKVANEMNEWETRTRIRP